MVAKAQTPLIGYGGGLLMTTVFSGAVPYGDMGILVIAQSSDHCKHQFNPKCATGNTHKYSLAYFTSLMGISIKTQFLKYTVTVVELHQSP